MGISPPPVRTGSFRSLRATDPEELEERLRELRRDYTQLGPGGFYAEYTSVELPALRLNREAVAVSARVTSAPPPGFVTLGFTVETREDPRFHGQAVPRDGLANSAELWDLGTTGPMSFGGLVVELERIAPRLEGFELPRAGLSQLPARVLTPDPRRLEALRAWHRRKVAAIEAMPGLLAVPAVSRQLEDDLVQLLGATLESVRPTPHAHGPRGRRHRAVRIVEEYVASLDGDAVPRIPELCALAGVSQRTLAYAFRELRGITPERYVKVHRLDRARRTLRAAAAGTTTVTQAAASLGFSDMGRFAGDYRALFGEFPSATLARRP